MGDGRVESFGVQCGEIVLFLITQEVGTLLDTSLRQCGYMVHQEGEIGNAKGRREG